MGNAKIHPNVTALRGLVDKYGVDRVLKATNYTSNTLTQYMQPNGRKVISDAKLENTKIILEATEK